MDTSVIDWQRIVSALGCTLKNEDFADWYIGEAVQPQEAQLDDRYALTDVDIIQRAMQNRWRAEAEAVCESVHKDWKARLMGVVVVDLQEEEDYDRYFWIGRHLFRIPDDHKVRDCEPIDADLYDELDVLAVDEYLMAAPAGYRTS
jgi:hypothetical protein